MATSKQYAYYLEGNQIAIVEKDVSFDNDVDSKDYGPGASRQRWESPQSTVTDGLKIKYVYAPTYTIGDTTDLSSSIGNYYSDDGNLVITSNTATLSAFADGTDGDTTDVTVTSAAHGFSNGDSVIVTGTTNYNGTYTIDEVTTDTFDITVAFNAGEVTGSSTTLATLNVNYGNLSGYNISDGSYIVLQNADRFNGLHKTITKDAHNGGTNNKIKLETKYYGSSSLSSLDSVADLYYNVSVLEDESFELDLPLYLQKALIYYIKGKLAEDAGEIKLREYSMREFKKMIEKYENSRISGLRIVSPGSHSIR